MGGIDPAKVRRIRNGESRSISSLLGATKGHQVLSLTGGGVRMEEGIKCWEKKTKNDQTYVETSGENSA